jgi:uncharacterized protein
MRTLVTLAFMVLALLCCEPRPELATEVANYDTGSSSASAPQAKLDAGVCRASVSACVAQCDLGHAESCSISANFYAYGRGVERDSVRAAKYAQTACDRGDMEGCTTLGWLFAEGEGVEKDPLRAARLYQRACDGNSALACSNLGVAFGTGNGVEKDLARARRLFEKACESGHAQAERHGCYNLGHTYIYGRGVDADVELARVYLIRAAEQGNGLAYYLLAITTDSSAFAQSRAAYLLKHACLRQVEDACKRLEGLGVDWRTMRPDAATHQCDYSNLDECRDQCNKFHLGSCSHLGVMYVRGETVEADIGAGLPFLERACEGAIPDACFELAAVVVAGKSASRTRDEARELLADACDVGHGGSCQMLATSFNPENAEDLHRRACSWGSGWACFDLARATEEAQSRGHLLRRACLFGYRKACVDAP